MLMSVVMFLLMSMLMYMVVFMFTFGVNVNGNVIVNAKTKNTQRHRNQLNNTNPEGAKPKHTAWKQCGGKTSKSRGKQKKA